MLCIFDAMHSLLAASLLLPSLSFTFPLNVIENRASCYSVNGVGPFTNHVIYDFSTLKSLPLPDGLYMSQDPPIAASGQAKYARQSLSSNVDISNGFLEIKFPGGQNPSNNTLTYGEVHTAANVLYGSVRTYATLSKEVGTCQGMFFYKSDTQEIDIEFLSDPKSTAQNGVPALHYTNQHAAGQPTTTNFSAPPSGYDSSVVEYRTDWTKDYTAFYVNGVLQQKYTQNVPTIAGTWLWNNWANGDPTWSVGPPVHDSVMRIQKIEMYFNSTASASC